MIHSEDGEKSFRLYWQLVDTEDKEHLRFTAEGDRHFFADVREELPDIFEGAGFVASELCFFETPFISNHVKIQHTHSWMPTPLRRNLDWPMSRRSTYAVRVTHRAGVDS